MIIMAIMHRERVNFTRLALGCIQTNFCNRMLIRKLSPRSTQCAFVLDSVQHLSNLRLFAQTSPNMCSILANLIAKLLTLSNFGASLKMLTTFWLTLPDFARVELKLQIVVKPASKDRGCGRFKSAGNQPELLLLANNCHRHRYP